MKQAAFIPIRGIHPDGSHEFIEITRDQYRFVRRTAREEGIAFGDVIKQAVKSMRSAKISGGVA